MSTSSIVNQKHYHDVKPADVKLLEEHAEAILEQQTKLRRVTAKAVLAIGKELSEARKKLSKHGTGRFGLWLKKRLKFSRRTTYNYINAYQCFGDCATVAPMFDATAMYVLAKGDVPRDAVTEALAVAEQGKHITRKLAEQLIADAYGQQDKPPTDKEAKDQRGSDEWRAEDRKERPRKTALERLKSAWGDASQRERRRFRKWLKNRTAKLADKRHRSISKREVICMEHGGGVELVENTDKKASRRNRPR